MARARHIPAEQPAWKAVQAWFWLTDGERVFVAAVLAIFLIGLIARHAHLKRMATTPVPTPAEEPDAAGGIPR